MVLISFCAMRVRLVYRTALSSLLPSIVRFQVRILEDGSWRYEYAFLDARRRFEGAVFWMKALVCEAEQETRKSETHRRVFRTRKKGPFFTPHHPNCYVRLNSPDTSIFWSKHATTRKNLDVWAIGWSEKIHWNGDVSSRSGLVDRFDMSIERVCCEIGP